VNRHLRRKENKKQGKNAQINEELIKAINTHSSGDLLSAKEMYLKLFKKNSSNYDLIRHLGILFQDLKDNEKAYNFFLKAVKLRPNGYEAYNNLGAIHVLNKNQSLALKCFEKSYSINPDYVPTINNLAGLHHRLHNGALALEFAKKSLSLQPKNIISINQYAKALVLNNQIDEGIKIFKELSKNNPERPDFKANLATALKEIGNFSESKKIIDEEFKKDFKRIDFFAPFAADKENTLEDKHIIYYKSLFESEKLDNEDKIIIAHTLFGYYRNKKNFEESGRFLELSNSLQYQLKDFDLSKEEYLFSKIKKIFSEKNNFITEDKKNKVKPIFICGMPRSGTTLCEQIISTHSKVSAAGELSDLIKICGLENIIQSDKEKINEFQVNLQKEEFLQNVKDKYLSVIEKFQSENSIYVTDKLPHNFILIGLIKLIFPKAKIIYCKRNPMDNCFSLFTHKFVDLAHQYSYNQKLLGDYYLMHSQLMKFWLKKYNDIYVLDNESLVNNQESISKELISYCELNWEENCLNFHKNIRQVRTASIEQVREPINSRSIGAWKKYSKYLKILESTLTVN
tara:strand:- start:2131 stop:3840 length:1710 start_codon:yes stop_codon:yes gene_type:complete